MLQCVLLRVGQIPNQRAARGNRKLLILKAHLLDRFPEMRLQAFRGVRIGERLLAQLARHRTAAGIQRAERLQIAYHDLARVDSRQLVRHGNVRVRNLIEIEFAGRHIAQCTARLITAKGYGKDVVRSSILEDIRFNDRSGRDHARDLTFDKSLRERGIGHLLTNCDLIALLDHLLEIGFNRVIGNSAHRRALAETAIAARERQIQFLGRQLCILEKHLVEIAQTEKENRVRVFLLDGHILLHHRRERQGSSPLILSCEN